MSRPGEGTSGGFSDRLVDERLLPILFRGTFIVIPSPNKDSFIVNWDKTEFFSNLKERIEDMEHKQKVDQIAVFCAKGECSLVVSVREKSLFNEYYEVAKKWANDIIEKERRESEGHLIVEVEDPEKPSVEDKEKPSVEEEKPSVTFTLSFVVKCNDDVFCRRLFDFLAGTGSFEGFNMMVDKLTTSVRETDHSFRVSIVVPGKDTKLDKKERDFLLRMFQIYIDRIVEMLKIQGESSAPESSLKINDILPYDPGQTVLYPLPDFRNGCPLFVCNLVGVGRAQYSAWILEQFLVDFYNAIVVGFDPIAGTLCIPEQYVKRADFRVVIIGHGSHIPEIMEIIFNGRGQREALRGNILKGLLRLTSQFGCKASVMECRCFSGYGTAPLQYPNVAWEAYALHSTDNADFLDRWCEAVGSCPDRNELHQWATTVLTQPGVNDAVREDILNILHILS